ncbi:MAG: hypothetical protein ACTSW4_02955 [Candidatus Ranarchaeia archaeon]
MQLPYGLFFQIGMVVQFILMILCYWLAYKYLDQENPYQPLVKAFAFVLTFSMVFLAIAYIWQVTAGWIV